MPGQCVFPTRVEQKRQQGAPAPFQGVYQAHSQCKALGSGAATGAGSCAHLVINPQLLCNKVTLYLVYGPTLFPSIWCYLIISFKPKISNFIGREKKFNFMELQGPIAVP